MPLLDSPRTATPLNQYSLLPDPQLCLCQQTLERDALRFDFFAGAFFAVYYGDDFGDGGTGFGDHFCGFECLASGGGDVFDHQDAVALGEFAFELFGGAVAFFLVADEDEGGAAGHGGGADEGDAAEFGAGEAVDVGVGVFGQAVAEFAEDVRLCLEEVLVEVVLALAAAAEGEVAVEQGGVADAVDECLVVHGGQYMRRGLVFTGVCHCVFGTDKRTCQCHPEGDAVIGGLTVIGYTRAMPGRDLTGRVIVITGAGSGIGAATATACAAAGMVVVLAGRRAERLEEVADRIGADGGEALAVPCDVTRDGDVRELFDRAMGEFGRVDAFFANAGITCEAGILDTNDQRARELFETNFFGTLRCIHAGVAAIRETAARNPEPVPLRHALICSSAISEIGLPLTGVYCATKAAQDSVAGALRAEVADEGIVVSSIHPIGTRTDLFLRADGSTRSLHTPASLMHPPERVGRAVVRCLRRPRAEVWPSGVTRWGLAVCTALPGVSAWAMRRLHRRLTGGIGGGDRAKSL